LNLISFLNLELSLNFNVYLNLFVCFLPLFCFRCKRWVAARAGHDEPGPHIVAANMMFEFGKLGLHVC